MTGTRSYPGPDAARSRLRLTIATIERELDRLSTQPMSDLRASVMDLIAQLALGPEPEVRRCSVCGHLGMLAATACGHCWTKLDPPPAAPGDVEAAR